MLSRAEEEIAKKAFVVILYQYNDRAGKLNYAYVGVRLPLLDKFYAAIKTYEKGQGKEIDFTKFGAVIEKGSGAPSKEVQARMKKDFNFNHEQPVLIPSPVTEPVIQKALKSLKEGSKKAVAKKTGAATPKRPVAKKK